MAQTFTQLVDETQDTVSDFTDEAEVLIKRYINQGNQKFNSALRRYATRLAKKTDLVEDQQYYQFPQDTIRVSGVVVTSNSVDYPLEEVVSEIQWRELNASNSTTADIPRFFFVRGFDEIGLWPVPSEDVTDGLEIWYEPRQEDLVAADVTTGTVTVTNGSTTVTHSGTSFTQSMIGRSFQVTDGTHGFWYKIAGFTSTSVITLDNYYDGISGSGRTFIIGQVPQFPEEFHDALVDYAASRHYRRKRKSRLVAEHRALFEDALERCINSYAKKSTSKVISRKHTKFDSPFTRLPDIIT